MTPLEAYKWLYVHYAPCGDETKQDDAITTALKALSLQIPKKAAKHPDGFNPNMGLLKCPHCLSTIGTYNDRLKLVYKRIEYAKCCEECGQMIDWNIYES